MKMTNDPAVLHRSSTALAAQSAAGKWGREIFDRHAVLYDRHTVHKDVIDAD